MKKEEIQAAIDVCKRWLKHIEQQKQNTATLQKAASLARKGDKDEALRLKEQVDNQPRVFDGANFEDVMPTILSALEAQLDDGWRPIETAPKIGQWYFVNVKKCYNSDFLKHITLIAFADSIDNEGIYWISDQDGSRVYPTHWKPLPKPPSNGGDDD